MRKLAPSLLRHRDPFNALECYNGLLKQELRMISDQNGI